MKGLPDFLSKKSNIIGLDIGTFSIKLAQFKRKEGKLQLTKLLAISWVLNVTVQLVLL